MLNNLTIKSRLILVIGFLSLLAIALGVTGLIGMKKANDGLLRCIRTAPFRWGSSQISTQKCCIPVLPL